ncbi:hypothetical protein BC332_15112 [Capsicum chinense]|nr:hypothetical protein BC332_15112 [Capsicum chinense]
MQRASTIVLRGNVFVGTVPKELANLIALTELYIGRRDSVGDDDFTGSIPTSTFNMSALLFLGLQLNRLSDTLPLDLVRGSLS